MHLRLILSLREMELPSGLSVEVEPVVAGRDISEAWAIAIFTVPTSVPASVIASLLRDELKKINPP